nr:MAG TPA: hypothetical protein [Caudoviricetes sp.]
MLPNTIVSETLYLQVFAQIFKFYLLVTGHTIKIMKMK